MSPSAFDSLRPSGRRTRRWWAKVGGASRPSSRARRIWVGVASSRSRPRTTRSIALAQVVDDDRERVGPVARPGRGSARSPLGRDLVRARPDERVHPPLRAAAERDAQDRPGAARGPGSRPGSPGRATDARASPPTPRTSSASSRSRRPGRRRAAARAPPRTAPRRRAGGRAVIRHEPEPGEVLEQRRVVLGAAAPPVVVLDPEQHGRPGRGPSPRRGSRSRRGRGGGSRSAPARTGSGSRRARRYDAATGRGARVDARSG